MDADSNPRLGIKPEVELSRSGAHEVILLPKMTAKLLVSPKSRLLLEKSVHGTFVPENFRSRERMFHRWNFRSLELSSSGTFVLKSEISMELSFLTFALTARRRHKLQISFFIKVTVLAN